MMRRHCGIPRRTLPALYEDFVQRHCIAHAGVDVGKLLLSFCRRSAVLETLDAMHSMSTALS
jgi:hypothetical protein